MWTILLLIGSNIFMTFAWYGHLKFREVPLWKVILVSWCIAFFEYCLQVPANRIGAKTFSPDQLKVIQEIITLAVFGVFSTLLLWRQAALEPLCRLRLPGGGGLLHVSQVLGGPLPPLPARKLFIFNYLRHVVVCKIVLTKGLRPKFASKRVSPGLRPGLACFDLYIQYSELDLTNTPSLCR